VPRTVNLVPPDFRLLRQLTRAADRPGDGQITKSGQASLDHNILIFRNGDSVYIQRIPFHSEGRRPTSSTQERAVMGRKVHARRAGPERTAKPCGSDILDAGIKFAVSPAGDGGTVIAGKTTEQPYKPLRGECRVSRCDRGVFTK